MGGACGSPAFSYLASWSFRGRGENICSSQCPLVPGGNAFLPTDVVAAGLTLADSKLVIDISLVATLTRLPWCLTLPQDKVPRGLEV